VACEPAVKFSMKSGRPYWVSFGIEHQPYHDEMPVGLNVSLLTGALQSAACKGITPEWRRELAGPHSNSTDRRLRHELETSPASHRALFALGRARYLVIEYTLALSLSRRMLATV
jgi:hypothetical protein